MSFSCGACNGAHWCLLQICDGIKKSLKIQRWSHRSVSNVSQRQASVMCAAQMSDPNVVKFKLGDLGMEETDPNYAGGFISVGWPRNSPALVDLSGGNRTVLAHLLKLLARHPDQKMVWIYVSTT